MILLKIRTMSIWIILKNLVWTYRECKSTNVEPLDRAFTLDPIWLLIREIMGIWVFYSNSWIPCNWLPFETWLSIFWSHCMLLHLLLKLIKWKAMVIGENVTWIDWKILWVCCVGFCQSCIQRSYDTCNFFNFFVVIF